MGPDAPSAQPEDLNRQEADKHERPVPSRGREPEDLEETGVHSPGERAPVRQEKALEALGTLPVREEDVMPVVLEVAES
jgi:hypothetical protein